MSSKDAVADIHGNSRGNSFTWKPSASVYTLLVNIRWLDNEVLARRGCTEAQICVLWGHFLLKECGTDSKPTSHPCDMSQPGRRCGKRALGRRWLDLPMNFLRVSSQEVTDAWGARRFILERTQSCSVGHLRTLRSSHTHKRTLTIYDKCPFLEDLYAGSRSHLFMF